MLRLLPPLPSPAATPQRRRAFLQLRPLHHKPFHIPSLPNPYLLPLRLRYSPLSTSASSSDNDGGVGGSGFDEDDEEDGIGSELRRLLALLPETMQRKLESHPELNQLIEIVMDLGRKPLARFPSGDFVLSEHPITFKDLCYATSQVGDFSSDNRAGISRTLHRISAIRNRKGVIVALTCRVGRAVSGSADSLRDLVRDGGSLLLIGPPGVGKTTIIREIARMLADDYKKRVMIVDTSNEIGGDGDIPHPGIGNARRMQVPISEMQHKVLIEAVENHMPQAIVIDEIGTQLEAMAASTIAQRGIQLVATAHGVTIENLIMNPSLEMLVGGIQSVTLGDEEASRRRVQKTILERKGPSTFTCGVEIISKTELRVHRSLEATVDALLSGRSPKVEVRKIDSHGFSNEMVTIKRETVHDTASGQQDKLIEDEILGETKEWSSNGGYNSENVENMMQVSPKTEMVVNLFVYGILETSVVQAIKLLKMNEVIQLTDNISEADAFLALHAKLKKNSRLQAVAESHNLPIYVTKTSSLEQIAKAVRALTNKHGNGLKGIMEEDEMSSSEKTDALEEARLAIEQVVIPKGQSAELLPRPSHIVSVQIDLVQKYNLKAVKVGEEPDVYLRILPFLNTTGDNSSIRIDDDDVGELQDMSSLDNLDISHNSPAILPLLPEH